MNSKSEELILLNIVKEDIEVIERYCDAFSKVRNKGKSIL